MPLNTIENADRLVNDIRRIREEQGLTVRGLARKANMQPSVVSAIETQKRPLTYEMMIRLYRAMGFDVHLTLTMQGNLVAKVKL